MTEAEILAQITAARVYLDTTMYQLIGLTVAVVVGVYYFLHRAGLVLKLAAFGLYGIGWFTLFSSAAITSQQLIGLYRDLAALQKAGATGQATGMTLSAIADPSALAYVVVMNAGLWALLVGAFLFLFFWKPPRDRLAEV